MSRNQLLTIVAGLFLASGGGTLLLHLIRPYREAPRWGNRKQNGPLMSRRSILLAGASTFAFGVVVMASAAQIWWIQHVGIPVCCILTVIAWLVACLGDFAKRRDA